MFRVTEYIAKSFKVTENGIIRKLAYGFLFTLHNNYGRIFSRFDKIHERARQTPHHGIGRTMCSAVWQKSDRNDQIMNTKRW